MHDRGRPARSVQVAPEPADRLGEGAVSDAVVAQEEPMVTFPAVTTALRDWSCTVRVTFHVPA